MSRYVHHDDHELASTTGSEPRDEDIERLSPLGSDHHPHRPLRRPPPGATARAQRPTASTPEPREGDTRVVPKLDRLARSVPDARAIGDELAAQGVKLSLGGTIYDPHDPTGKMFFNILAIFAEFEVDLLRLRTREGMAVARSKGRLKGKAPKLTRHQHTYLLELHTAGEPHDRGARRDLHGQPRNDLSHARSSASESRVSARARSPGR